MATDRKDLSLLRALQTDGRATNAELAKRVHLSESACLRRIRQLEASGVISGYAAVIDQRAIGLTLTVFLSIRLVSQSEATLSAFEEAAQKVPEILECYLVTGEADYLIRVVAKDIDAFEALHATTLTRLPGVARIVSSIALRNPVKKQGLPVR